ncbi:hypothetical protein UFOVP713_40 [uncultured Caudovirales phage]|jgi:hypothetical protein|uniref:Uncharacterized protein n=1 Tax=uncultured Caudovirales phage TaxID=2100421 RepID=A0A6J5NNM0_9CAUD|nr:hypothetical protein UFOVP713_40 [uncultured Caudovirales phage]
MTIKTMGVEELSVLLRRAVDTIRSDARRRPETLPPRIVIPGTSKLLWLEEDVVNWMKEHRDD